MPRALFFVNRIPFLLTHRMPLLRATRDAGYDVHVAYGDGDPAPLDAENIPHTHVPFRRGLAGPWEYLRAPARLAGLYRRWRPDVVHAFPLKSTLYAARAGVRYARRFRAPPPALVGAATGLGHLFTDDAPLKQWTRRRVFAILRDRLARQPVRLIVQNDDDARLLLDARVVDPARLRSIPGAGVDVDAFQPPPPDGPECLPGPPAAGLAPVDERVTVALPARLLRDKGVEEFVEAARRLRARGLRARFILAGDVDPDNPTSVSPRTLRAWTDAGDVESAGWVDDMPTFWRRVAVACLPSYREGCPKALLDAMAAGRPCVSTDVPGCRQTVEDGVTGRLVPARNAEALTEALAEVIEDASKRRAWGKAGRERAERFFSLPRILSMTLAVFDEALRAAHAEADTIPP